MSGKKLGVKMKIAMPIVTDAEITDGYRFHYQNYVLVAYDTPDETGHAMGTIRFQKDYDLWFVWTTLGYWVFLEATKADHEK
jgi:hypothetical protein